MFNTTYIDLFDRAERGEPKAMFELAKLYDSNAISSASDSEYIYWLKKFMDSNQVNSIVEELDNEESTNHDLDFMEAYLYYPMIIEAGIALGLYFKNSSNIDEVKLACQSFYTAYEISRFDFLEIESEDGTIDILSLILQTEERIRFLQEVR